MAASTVLEIANQALYRLGAEPITALVPTPTSERSRAINAAWPFVRTEVLRAHSWNFAIQREILLTTGYTGLWDFDAAFKIPSDCLRVLEVETDYPWRREGVWILTDGIDDPTVGDIVLFTGTTTAADPVVCVATAHGLSTGDLVTVSGSEMTEINDRVFKIEVESANTFALGAEDGTGRTTGSSGGVRVIESGGLYIRYLKDVTDPSLYDDSFTAAVVARLAAEVCVRLTDSRSEKQALLSEYMELLRQAKRFDGEEQNKSEFVEDDWITVRN